MAKNLPVRFTADALADLDTIGAYIAEHRGLDEAEKLLDRITRHVASLGAFPLRGPVPKEIKGMGDENVRQNQVGRYRILYDLADGQLSVFMIADGRRDIGTLLAGRLIGRPAPD